MHAVFLSPLAEKKLQNLLIFLEQNWSRSVRDSFLEKLLSKINFVANHPDGCVKSTHFLNLFKCVVTKQTSFYYRQNENEIEIISIFDNRQNPKKRRSELRK